MSINQLHECKLQVRRGDTSPDYHPPPLTRFVRIAWRLKYVIVIAAIGVFMLLIFILFQILKLIFLLTRTSLKIDTKGRKRYTGRSKTNKRSPKAQKRSFNNAATLRLKIKKKNRIRRTYGVI